MKINEKSLWNCFAGLPPVCIAYNWFIAILFTLRKASWFSPRPNGGPDCTDLRILGTHLEDDSMALAGAMKNTVDNLCLEAS